MKVISREKNRDTHQTASEIEAMKNGQLFSQQD